MSEFLAFVAYEGKSVDEKYVYRFDFTVDKDTAWGDFFNVAPSVIVPNLSLDKNCISSYMRCKFPTQMLLACTNTCFSMQDCIDGILPLCFCEINENMLKYHGKPLFFSFGESFDDVEKKMTEMNLEIFEHAIIEEENTIIDDLINSLGDDGND